MSRIIKICPCGKEISVIYSLRIRKKYCSKPCRDKYKLRKKGIKYTIHKENPTAFKKGMAPHNKGKPNPNVKENPGCGAIHDWVKRWKLDPGYCEMCGVSGVVLDWSSKSAKRLRDLDDWQRLCRKCHCAYDYENFGTRKVFYER